MTYPETIKKLIDSFKLLPGIGEKNAERLAFSILKMEDEEVKKFAEGLTAVKQKVKKCKSCNNISEEELCEICSSKFRNNDILCVVEDYKNVFLFEKLQKFQGKYFVLDGLISPIDGRGPKEIGINNLIDKINKENYSEIILALKPSIEGETTALYIKKLLENKNIKISKIAHGVPLGADMEYLDNLTLETALEDRKEI